LDSSSQSWAEDFQENSDRTGIAVRLVPIDAEDEWEPEDEPGRTSTLLARRFAQTILDALTGNQADDIQRTRDPLPPMAAELVRCLDAWDAAYAQADPKRQYISAMALADVLESIGKDLERDGTTSSVGDALLEPCVVAITAVLEESLCAAARCELWASVLQLRGRYFRWWGHKCSVNETLYPSNRSVWSVRRSRRIGEQIGSMHARGIVHGTALSESFDAGARAHNFARTAYDSSPEARLSDLVSFRYQVNDNEWRAFCEGYRNYAGDEAGQRLDQAERRASDTERLDTLRGLTLPAARQPAFCIRAISYALRNFPDLAGLLNGTQGADVEEGGSSLAAERIISSLQESFSLNEEVTRGASAQLLSQVMNLYADGNRASVTEIVTNALREAGHALSADEQIKLKLYLHLSHLVPEDEDGSACAMEQAAVALIQLEKPDCLQTAVHIAYSAIGKAQKPVTREKCLATCARALLMQSRPLGNPAHLEPILDLAVLAPNPTDGHQEALDEYESLVGRLLSLSPEVRSRIYKTADWSREGSALLEELEDAIEEAIRAEAEEEDYGIPKHVMWRIRAEDWNAAANLLRRELEKSAGGLQTGAKSIGCAAMLCSVLHQLRDFEPQHHNQLAVEVRGLVLRVAPILLDADSDLLRDHRANMASTVGFAAISAVDDLTGEDATQLLACGINLMELSTSLRDEMLEPDHFSFAANNLALGYQSIAEKQDKAGAIDSLEQARDLLERVIRADERLALRKSVADRSVSRSMHIDLSNLGLVCRDLGDRTYSKKMISFKPKESATFYRRAMRAFMDSRDLAFKAGRRTNAATASNKLAALLLEICQTFVAERHWAGGDIHGAYYDWLCTLAGGPVGTARLFKTCAVAALRSSSDAAREQHTNSLLMIECVDTMIALFSLFQRKLAFDSGLRRDALVTILEVLETLPSRLQSEVSRNHLGDLKELLGLFEALLRVELYGAGCGSLDQLQAARESFAKTRQHARFVERAIARPYSRWLDVVPEAAGMVVNGLYVAGSPSGIEFRIPSQRRSLEFRGLTVLHVNCRLQNSGWLEKMSGLATAHMEPHFHLQDVPTNIATTEIKASCDQSELTLTACKLPIASWDSWAMTLIRNGAGELKFSVTFPFLGKYDLETHALDQNLPSMLTSSTQVLLFGNPGVVLELGVPLGAGDIGRVLVSGNREGPDIQLDANAISLILKTAPQIALGDVAYFVKQEQLPDDAALCCSGSLPSVSPSLSLPSTVLHSFSPLFFFEEGVAPGALEIINRFDIHEIVLIGIPASPDAADAALEALFDPRRELFLLVEAGELEPAGSAIDRLRRKVRQSAGGRRLLASSASADGYFEDFSNIQLIIVPRLLAAAASQMLLDLAAVRRASIEGRCIIKDNRVYRLNPRGNIIGWQRRTTLFPLGTSWETLTESYCGKSAKSQEEKALYLEETSDAMKDLLAGRVGKRPVVIFQPGGESSPALAPFIRHRGAIPLPATSEGFDILKRLRPDEVYAQAGLLTEGLFESSRREELPAEASHLAVHFQDVVRRDHATLLNSLETTHPSLLSSRVLLEEARPAEYAVVSLTSKTSRPWTYLATNYAAALGSPLLLLDQDAGSEDGDELRSTLLQGADIRGFDGPVIERHFAALERSLQRVPSALSRTGDHAIAALNPTYVGVVCERPDVAIELAGEPPLATRVAIGRLAGPDLVSTSILITRAALSENIERTSILEAVVMEAANALQGKPLPGAILETEAIFRSLQKTGGVNPRLLPDVSRSKFLSELENAQIVHFAGHGVYRGGDSKHSGLIVSDGIISELDLTLSLSGEPLVFSNACESGILSSQGKAGRAWSGLAAAFINAGAVNYLGSLWPVSDKLSQQLAESFYRNVFAKCATGEALRRAREAAFDRRDSTWAAYVLFGCPRTRLFTLN
jgi:hypothetical protein